MDSAERTRKAALVLAIYRKKTQDQETVSVKRNVKTEKLGDIPQAQYTVTMKLLNFTTCSLLQVFFVFMLFQYIACDCPFPDDDFPDGRIIYQSESDINKTVAEDLYILKFECFARYQMIGKEYIQCVDGDWNDEVPFCTLMECSRPPSIENAKYVVKSGVNEAPTLGSSAVYTCKEGFELNDTDVSSLRCALQKKSKNTVWKGELPSCKAKSSCPDPGVSKNGGRRGRLLFSGSFHRYYCNEGYELVGEQTIHCLPTGEWSSLRPLCKPSDEHCELPPVIQHGLVTGHKQGDYFVPDEEAQVVCAPGYKCEGPEFVYCEEGGEWESEFGECTEIFCDPPPPLANGTILELQSTNMTSFPYNFELTYVCDKGYRLNGDSWRICGKRGWSSKTPVCEVIQCPDPGIPENGMRKGDNYSVSSSVIFSCFYGYELLGSIQRYCMSNGQWSGELASCDDPLNNYCPNPGIPIKGSKDSTNYELGEKIGFRCQDGYIQIGSQVRECLFNHTWSGTETKCLGPYDFDSDTYVRDTLKEKLAKKAKEQEKELQKYNELRRLHKMEGRPLGRTIDVNYPGRLILYFAFDVSGSVGSHNFRKSIDFAKAIVNKVGISPKGARAGAITFSSKAEEQFLPLHYNTTQGVLDALDKINYTGGGTAASSAFTLIRTEFMPLVEEVLGKLNIKSIIFLITDGKANMGGSPTEEADILKQAGVEIYCIGITGDVRKKTLYDLASKSKRPETGEEYPNVYILQNYATLSWLVQELTNGTVDYSQCGLGLENVGNMGRGKIVGGNKSNEPWPWMAALYMRVGEDIPPRHELKCGGSIIHRHFILTAAHCLFRNLHTNPVLRNRTSIIIKLGLTDTQNESYVQEFEVRKMLLHPKYHPGSFFDHDIALLQIRRPVEYNAFVRPVCLPPKELPDDSTLYSPNSPAWATGWGHNEVVQREEIFKAKSTRNLKEIYLPIQHRERCIESARSNAGNASYFTDRMFCAGDGRGGNDTCQGDSGGPLMQPQANSEGSVYWTQIGIVSWGVGCGLRNTYGYYTYVQRLVPWIDDTIEKALKAMEE